MSIKYEYYITGVDAAYQINAATLWRAQTFTPSISHTITSVILKIYRNGTPGVVTASIRTVSGNVPTGSDLCSGVTNGDTLPEYPPHYIGEWREITLGIGTLLTSGTLYAIVLRPAANSLYWEADDGGSYAGGNGAWSQSDAGITWATLATDFMFEEWGDSFVTDKTPISSDGYSVKTKQGLSTYSVGTESGLSDYGVKTKYTMPSDYGKEE